jgi:hypothetical protein
LGIGLNGGAWYSLPMAVVFPLPVPTAFVNERGVVLANDFSHQHLSICFNEGRAYFLSRIFYNYHRYNEGDDRDLDSLVVGVFALGSKQLERLVTLEKETKALTHHRENGRDVHTFNNDIHDIAVSPSGHILLSTSKNRLLVLDSHLEQHVAFHDPLTNQVLGFSDVMFLPNGQFWFTRNRLEFGLGAAWNNFESIPKITPLGTLLDSKALDENTVSHRISFHPYRVYVGPLSALDDDRLLVSFFTRPARSGGMNDGDFRYVLLNGTGEVIAELPLGAADSPYIPASDSHLRCCAHTLLNGFVSRSENAFHLFNREGVRTARAGIGDDKELSSLKGMQLLGVSPGGELALVNAKHHTLLLTNPIQKPSELHDVLREAGAAYKPQFSALKKTYSHVAGRFVGTEKQLADSAPRAKKAQVKRKAEPLPPEQIQTQPIAPDINRFGVLADQLIERAHPMGEYMALSRHIELSQTNMAPAYSIGKEASSRNQLLSKYGTQWFQTWNSPEPLFESGGPTTFGLPNQASINKPIADGVSFDAQVAALPISSVKISDLNTASVLSILNRASIRNVEKIEVSGDSKSNLGTGFVSGLLKQPWPQLKTLSLYRVETTAKSLLALGAHMPHLVSLTAPRCSISAESLNSLAHSALAPGLHSLNLYLNPLGSAAIASLAKFNSLKTLSLKETDIGDDIDAPNSMLGIQSLNLEDNSRLHARAAHWFVQCMPQLRHLQLPKETIAADVDAWSAGELALESLSLPWSCASLTRQHIAKTWLPKLSNLKSLVLMSDEALGFPMEQLLSFGELKHLELGLMSRADIKWLSSSPKAEGLISLTIGGHLDDETLHCLGSSVHLPNLQTLVLWGAQTSQGLASVLRLPQLTSLSVVRGTVNEAAPLCVNEARVQLRLVSCRVSPQTRAQLARHFGVNLSVR